jgi:hypothetical protein
LLLRLEMIGRRHRSDHLTDSRMASKHIRERLLNPMAKKQ